MFETLLEQEHDITNESKSRWEESLGVLIEKCYLDDSREYFNMSKEDHTNQTIFQRSHFLLRSWVYFEKNEEHPENSPLSLL